MMMTQWGLAQREHKARGGRNSLAVAGVIALGVALVAAMFCASCLAEARPAHARHASAARHAGAAKSHWVSARVAGGRTGRPARRETSYWVATPRARGVRGRAVAARSSARHP